MPSNRLRKPKTQKYKAAMAVSDLIHSVRSNSLAALQKDIQMMKIYRPQSIFSVRSEIRRKISNFIHFDFAFRGFRFSEAGGSNLCRKGSFTFPLSHNYKFANKKKRHLTVSNIVKCLYFSGFAAILLFPFVSIKRFSFRNTSVRSSLQIPP